MKLHKCCDKDPVLFHPPREYPRDVFLLVCQSCGKNTTDKSKKKLYKKWNEQIKEKP